jgi:hypothetical protein
MDEGKIVPVHHAMKAYWRAPRILDLGQLHTSAALPPEKEPLVPIGKEVGWNPEPVWTRCRREKFLAIVGNRTPDHPTSSPSAIPMSYPGPTRMILQVILDSTKKHYKNSISLHEMNIYIDMIQ